MNTVYSAIRGVCALSSLVGCSGNHGTNKKTETTNKVANETTGQGFTEIRTPKIVARGAEGGSNVFKLEYFNKKAELGQSPQFYKQAMVGVYDRVFEAAPGLV